MVYFLNSWEYKRGKSELGRVIRKHSFWQHSLVGLLKIVESVITFSLSPLIKFGSIFSVLTTAVVNVDTWWRHVAI